MRVPEKESKERLPSCVISYTPARLCLGGGGTDVPPYCERKEGCVVTATIEAGLTVKVSPTTRDIILYLPNMGESYHFPLGKKIEIEGHHPARHPIIKGAINQIDITRPTRIEISSNLPVRPLGLGTSSSLAVGMLAALRRWAGLEINEKQIADEAITLERDILKIPGGFMDQYSASFGGLNFVTFRPGRKVTVEPIKIGQETLQRLQENLLFCFTGEKDPEGDQLPSLIKGMEDPEVEALFDQMAVIARKVKNALEEGDLEKFGRLLGQAWEFKKATNPIMTTPQIDRLYDVAVAVGALGGKLSGSGSGGFLSIYCPEGTKGAVKSVLEKEGGVIYSFSFVPAGLTVSETF